MINNNPPGQIIYFITRHRNNLPTNQWRDEVQRHEMNQPEDYFSGWLGLIGAGGALFLKKLAEHRINIILIANMLHRKIIKGGLQMLIFAP